MSERSPDPWRDEEFEAGLEETRTALQDIEARYRELQERFARRDELRSRQARLKRDRDATSEVRQRLQAIAAQLRELDEELDGILAGWEPFWWAVRFGGLGVVLGWVLHACAS